MTEYEKQAQDFLNKTKTRLDLTYITSDPQESSCFNDGKQRDVYQVTLTRDSRTYSFRFTQSLACSGKYLELPCNLKAGYTEKDFKTFRSKCKFSNIKPSFSFGVSKNPNFKEPTPYDILSCLTKHDPGDLEWFCSDFGYDTDSIRANDLDKSVKDEYQNMRILFSDKELEELQEIN